MHPGRGELQVLHELAPFVIKRYLPGTPATRPARDEVATWSTPAIASAGGRAQVVLNGWKRKAGYDLETGEELWRLRGGGDLPVPMPQVAGETIVLTNGQGRSPIYAVRAAARGDLTPTEGLKDLPPGLLWWLPKRLVANLTSDGPAGVIAADDRLDDVDARQAKGTKADGMDGPTISAGYIPDRGGLRQVLSS